MSNVRCMLLVQSYNEGAGVVMVMETHFICSGPVLRRGVGRKGVCVHMAGGRGHGWCPYGLGVWLVVSQGGAFNLFQI